MLSARTHAHAFQALSFLLLANTRVPEPTHNKVGLYRLVAATGIGRGTDRNAPAFRKDPTLLPHLEHGPPPTAFGHHRRRHHRRRRRRRSGEN